MTDVDLLLRETLTREAGAYAPGDLAEAEKIFVGRRRRHRAFRFGVATATAAAVVLAAAVVVDTGDVVKEDRLQVASQLRLVETVPVAEEPLAVSSGPPGIWVASRTGDEVTLVGRDGEIVRSYELEGANEIVAGAAQVWAAGDSGSVVAIDEETLEVNGEGTGLGSPIVDMAVGGTMHGAAWAVDASGCVTDLTVSGSVLECYAVNGVGPKGSHPTDVATDVDETWVLDGQRGELTQLEADPGVNEGRAIGTGPVPLPSTPHGKYADLLVAADAIWVSGEDGSLMRLDLLDGEKTYTDLGGDYADLAAGFNSIWALVGFEGADTGTVVRIDPVTGEMTGPELTLAGKPSDITVDGEIESGIWVTLRNANEVAHIAVEGGGE